MKFAVIVFPGSNCDHDAYYALNKILGVDVDFIWHKENALNKYDAKDNSARTDCNPNAIASAGKPTSYKKL